MAIVHIKGRDAALAWLKGLKQYGRAYNGNRIASTAVENGEIAMALSNNYYWYSLAREKGAGQAELGALFVPRQRRRQHLQRLGGRHAEIQQEPGGGAALPGVHGQPRRARRR